MNKKKIKKMFFESPLGILFFYKIRQIREKIALSKFSDLEYVKTTYKIRFGREINLKNATSYTEKLQWLKLFYRDPQMTVCADKFAVRDYLKQRGYEYLLNEIVGVYNSADEIDFDELPSKFVAKATHGSSWNLICKDKNKLNWRIWKRIMNSWLKLDLYVFGREWHYKEIKPRILIEKFIEHEPLNDYKFMCINGEPKYMQINNDYNGRHYVDFYDINWSKVDFTYLNYSQSDHLVEKPKQFDEMLRLAKELSRPFPFVRVDFYNFDDRIVFGELTFFPGGGMLPLVPVENNFDEIIGSQIKLPEPNHNLQLLSSL
jgi:hypothetical protein